MSGPSGPRKVGPPLGRGEMIERLKERRRDLEQKIGTDYTPIAEQVALEAELVGVIAELASLGVR